MPVQGKLAGAICNPFDWTVYDGNSDVVVMSVDEYTLSATHLDAMIKERDEYKDLWVKSVHTCNDLLSQRNDAQKLSSSFQDQLKAAEGALDPLVRELGDYRDTTKYLRDEVQSLRDQLKAAEAQIVSMAEKYKKLESEHGMLKTASITKDNDIAHLADRISHQASQVKHLTGENAILKAQAIHLDPPKELTVPQESIKLANEANTKVLIEHARVIPQVGDVVTFLVWHDIEVDVHYDDLWKFRRVVKNVTELGNRTVIVTLDQSLPTGYLVKIGDIVTPDSEKSLMFT